MGDHKKPRPTVPAPYNGPRATTYRYMYDMFNNLVRAYGDVEYGDVHDLSMPPGALVGMFNDVCVVTTERGTWVIRHRENGSLYLEDARGTDDASKVDASMIITDHRSRH